MTFMTLVEAILPRISETPTEDKRLFTANSLEKIWHADIDPNTKPELHQTLSLMRKGYNGIILINHFDKSNFLVLMHTFMRYSETFRKLQIVIPIAHHQNLPQVQALANFTNIMFTPLVTEDTIKASQKRRATHKPLAEWERLPLGSGYKEYLEAAREVFREQGLVVVAPRGRREAAMHPFVGNPIEHLLKKSPVDKPIFILPVGIEISGVTDYSRVSGYNLGKNSILRFGSPLTAEQLPPFRKRSNSGKVDQIAYKSLYDLTPTSYQVGYDQPLIIS